MVDFKVHSFDYHIYECKDYVMEYDKYINNILDTLFLSDI